MKGVSVASELSRPPNLLRYTWSSNINESLGGTQLSKSNCKMDTNLSDTESSENSALSSRQSLFPPKQETKNQNIRTVDASQVIPVVDIV